MTCIFLYFLYLTVTVQILAQQQTGTRSLYSTCSTTDLYKKLVQYLLNNELVQEVGTVPAQQRTGTRSRYSTCSTTNWYKKSVQYLSWPVQRRRTRHRHREPIISGRFVSLLSIWSLVTLFRIPLGYLKMKKCYLIVDRIFTFPLVEDSFNYSKQYFLNLQLSILSKGDWIKIKNIRKKTNCIKTFVFKNNLMKFMPKQTF